MLGRVQLTRDFVRYTGKFGISRVSYIGMYVSGLANPLRDQMPRDGSRVMGCVHQVMQDIHAHTHKYSYFSR